MQASLSEEKAALVALHQEKDTADKDWEQRLAEAVDSANQWKAFAEKLGSEKSDLDKQCLSLEDQLHVSTASHCYAIGKMRPIIRKCRQCLLPSSPD